MVGGVCDFGRIVSGLEVVVINIGLVVIGICFVGGVIVPESVAVIICDLGDVVGELKMLLMPFAMLSRIPIIGLLLLLLLRPELVAVLELIIRGSGVLDGGLNMEPMLSKNPLIGLLIVGAAVGFIVDVAIDLGAIIVVEVSKIGLTLFIKLFQLSIIGTTVVGFKMVVVG